MSIVAVVVLWTVVALLVLPLPIWVVLQLFPRLFPRRGSGNAGETRITDPDALLGLQQHSSAGYPR